MPSVTARASNAPVLGGPRIITYQMVVVVRGLDARSDWLVPPNLAVKL